MGTESTAEPLASVVRGVNAAHGTSYALVGRFRTGEQGAYRLRDAAGREWVLKWSPGNRDVAGLAATAQLLDRLRGAGHRAPRFAAWGALQRDPVGRYVVQEALPGAPPARIDQGLVAQILALTELQSGVAAGIPFAVPAATAHAPRALWPALPVRDVLDGGDGYCLLESMRAHSPRTAALLEALREFVAAHASGVAQRAATDDAVHFDLNPANVLAEQGRVTGVVDWDGACAGDRAFDLCTLLFYCYDPATGADASVRATLWDRACALSGPAAVGVYLAHMAHRQVEWMVRHHPHAVDAWLNTARAALADVAQRTAWPEHRLLAWTTAV